MPTLDGDEATIHYETAGLGYPLLLISGAGSSTASWKMQVEELSKYFQCIVYDARGVGLSTTTRKNATIHLLATDALRLLASLGVDECHVVGTSLGAATAQEMCLMETSSTRISSLVLHAPWDKTTAYPHLVEQFECRLELLRQGAWDLFERITRLFVHTPEYVNSNELAGQKRGRVSARSGGLGQQDNARALIPIFEALLDHNVRGRLGNVRIPCLVTAGADDFIVRPTYAEAVAHAIPDARFEVWEATGHLARTERPDLFTGRILSFLRGV